MGPKSDSQREQSVRSAQELGDKAKQSAGEVAETQFSSQKEKASGGMVHVADALRKSGEHLRGQQQDQIAGLAEKAADQVERISSYIKSSNLRQLVDEVEGLARREPALFLGGAFVLGVVGARFLKSSARRGSAKLARGATGRMQTPAYPRSPTPSMGGRGHATQAGQLGSSSIGSSEPFSASRPAGLPVDRGEH